jgi:hypothetical protein
VLFALTVLARPSRAQAMGRGRTPAAQM